jgi:hypothetical protein
VPSGEDKQAVERGGTTFAAGAGRDPNRVSHALDYITEANFFLGDETWQAHSIGPVFASLLGRLFCLHLINYIERNSCMAA